VRQDDALDLSVHGDDLLSDRAIGRVGNHGREIVEKVPVARIRLSLAELLGQRVALSDQQPKRAVELAQLLRNPVSLRSA
jgi:hypothetical protein